MKTRLLQSNTSDTYICQGIYDEDDMDTHYRFINVNDSEDWLYIDDHYDYQYKTPWTAGGNNLIYIECHSVITTIPVTVIPSAPVPNPTPAQPAPAPAQPAPAPSTSTSAPAAQTTAQPAAPKNNKKVKVASAKAGKKSVKVTWKKVKGIKGYQIQYSTNKKFKRVIKQLPLKAQNQHLQQLRSLKARKNTMYACAHIK